MPAMMEYKYQCVKLNVCGSTLWIVDAEYVKQPFVGVQIIRKATYWCYDATKLKRANIRGMYDNDNDIDYFSYVLTHICHRMNLNTHLCHDRMIAFVWTDLK